MLGENQSEEEAVEDAVEEEPEEEPEGEPKPEVASPKRRGKQLTLTGMHSKEQGGKNEAGHFESGVRRFGIKMLKYLFVFS